VLRRNARCQVVGVAAGGDQQLRRRVGNTADSYRSATAFLTATSAVVRIGVAGAASYAAGLTRALTRCGVSKMTGSR